jgi:hypothetical protein
MKLHNKISILKQYCESVNSTHHNGIWVDVCTELSLKSDVIKHTFTIGNTNEFIYWSKLVSSNWDSSKFVMEHSDLPKLNFNYEISIPKVDMKSVFDEWLITEQVITKLTRMDRKLNTKL